jgi:transcriptional regulator with XRE-family HTH domain
MLTPEEKAENARRRVRDYIFREMKNVQMDFARKAGFKKSNRLSDFLSGKTAVPEHATLAAYAAAMGLTVDQMTAPLEVGGAPAPHPPSPGGGPPPPPRTEGTLDYEGGVIDGIARALGKTLVIETLEAAARLDDPAEAPAILRRARASRAPRANGTAGIEPTRKRDGKGSGRESHRGGA